ncbi:hypothetical protein [Pelagibius sp.]|uniref:hypothetical protein n=1 Tax=Pelagibius sp. TaxID=1931238 RepID=UPI003BB19E30
MGETSRHRRIWHAARNLIVLTTTFALIVAPLIVILAHGPGAHAAAAAISMEIAKHGHDHGHTDEDTERDVHDDPFDGHNPADHDHPLHALVYQPENPSKPPPEKSEYALSDVFRHLTLEGLMRPPRFV